MKAALNGPQYISAGGTTDRTLRANGDIIRVPMAPGLGITLDERAEKSMTIAAQAQRLCRCRTAHSDKHDRPTAHR
jgi:hypothetical protein